MAEADASNGDAAAAPSTIPDQWGRERLLGKSVSFKQLTIDDEGEVGETKEGGGPTVEKRRSKKGTDEKLDPMLWGQPGHLTEEEADVYFQFKEEVEKRGGEFKDTIYSFGEIEGEVWALCRWLRARKFVYDEVIKMVEEATKVRAEAKARDFYPNPMDSLGCEASLFFAQYPQLYSGRAKNGAPLFISKPGVLNVDAMECITTLDGIVKFHWYVMMHDFGRRLEAQKNRDPEHFKRFECVCILDLAHLTLGQLSQRALAIIKEQSAIDSICFPETMCKMFIVNGPRFFGATWKLIRGWLDPRTAGKIEVISDRKNWEARLLEHVDVEQLPEDYGGKGPSTIDTIHEEATASSNLKRLHSEVQYIRGTGSCTFDLAADEEVEIAIYTPSIIGAKFSVTDADKKTVLVDSVEVKHEGTGDPKEQPTSKVITTSNIPGPLKLKVKGDSVGSRWSSQNFLVVYSVYPKTG